MKAEEEVKRLQAELEHRTEVEHQAEQLIIAGEYETAKKLLETLDDSKVKCSYLKEANFTEAVETTPGKHENMPVCKEHLGKLKNVQVTVKTETARRLKPAELG